MALHPEYLLQAAQTLPQTPVQTPAQTDAKYLDLQNSGMEVAARQFGLIGAAAESVAGLPLAQRQQAWQMRLAILQSNNVNVSKFPPQVPDDAGLSSLRSMALSQKDQIENRFKESELKLKQDQLGVSQGELKVKQDSENRLADVANRPTETAHPPGSHVTVRDPQGNIIKEYTVPKDSNIDPLSPEGIDATVKRDTALSAVPQRPAAAQPAMSPDRFNQEKGLRNITAAAAGARAAAASAPVEIANGSKEFRVAQDLAYGGLPLNDFKALYGRAAATANLKIAIYDKARELNPNFNPAAFEMGFTLAKNPKVQQQLASMDNVQQAVPDLLKLSDAASRTSITKLNDLIIKGGVQLGSKNYSNLATARTAFADELSGALGFGSATDMSKEMGIDMTRPDLSPDAFRSAIQDVVVPFIQRKRDTLLKQMGVYGQPGMNPAAPPAKPITDALIQRNMQTNPKATKQQIIDALKAAGCTETK